MSVKRPVLLPWILVPHHGLVLIAIFVWASLCGAQEGKDCKVINSQFIFSRRVPNGSWTPMLSHVENTTGREQNVMLVTDFQVGGTGTEKVSFTREFLLPPHTKRMVETFVMMDYPPKALTSLFSVKTEDLSYSDGVRREVETHKAETFEFETRVVDLSDGHTFHKYPFYALPVHPYSQFFASADGLKPEFKTDTRYLHRNLPYVLGEHPDDPRYVSSSDWPGGEVYVRRLQPDSDEVGAVLQNSHVNIHQMPRKWAAYEGVSVILMGSLRASDGSHGLSMQQRHSLLRYVRAGGRIVVMPGMDLEAYRHPFWRQLLPVRLMGVRQIHDELGALEDRYGAKITMDRDLPLRLVEALPGEDCEVLVRHHENILMARRHVGSGEVYFLAVTGGTIDDWSKGHRLFANLLRPRLEPAPGLRTSLPAHAGNFLGHVVGAEAPSRFLIVVLLGGYCLAGGAVLLVFRWKGRAEIAWPILAILAILAAGAAFVVGQINASRIGFVVGEIGVTVLGNNDANGSAVSFVGFYPPRSIEEDVRWSNPDTLATLHSTWRDEEGGIERSLRVKQDNHFTFEKMRLNRMELATARTMTLVRYGDGVTVDVAVGKNGLRATVANRTGHPLRRCLLHLNRRWIVIGDLQEGESREVTERDLVWNLDAAGFGKTQSDKVRDYVLAEILRVPRKGGFLSERLFAWPVAVYGWVDIPQTDGRIEGVEPKDVALQLLVAPTWNINASGEVRIPPGVCGLRLLRGGSRSAYGDADEVPPAYEHIKLPEKTRIAGMRKQKQRRNDPDNSVRENLTGMPSQQQERPKTMDELHALPQWRSDTLPARIRAGFVLPEGMPPVDVKTVKVYVDLDVRDLKATLNIRKPGTSRFTRLNDLDAGGGAIEMEVPDLKQYLGDDGALPEFELSLSKSVGMDPTVPGYWSIRMFDVEVEGRVVETDAR